MTFRQQNFLLVTSYSALKFKAIVEKQSPFSIPMDKVNGKLTVFLEEPFWVGIFERIEDGKLSAAKVTFGAEPKDCEVQEYIQKWYFSLKFSPVVETVVKDIKRNPKRMQREAKKQMLEIGIGTKSQQALKLQQEQNKQERKEKSRKRKEAEEQRMFELKQRKKLEENAKNIARIKDEKKRADELREVYLKWDRLCHHFGDEKGTNFRNIAQSFVLKELLNGANFYLQRLTERYELECQAGSLTILLRDLYQGGAARPACTLSGGESFLVSLSLALGLSSLSRHSLSVDTLFIDEGFGTLSSDYLNTVMDTLEKLHQMGGKKVGIISHVEGLRERIKTQIQVKRIDNSRSEITTVRTL